MKQLFSHGLTALVLSAILVAAGCTSPRSIIASGKVTPKGSFKAGASATFNIAAASIAEIVPLTKAAVNDLDRSSRDTIYYTATTSALLRGLVAYSLDPVTLSYDFYARYGIANRFDIGYKYAGGTHVFDAMYQFLGSTGTPRNPGDAGRWYGSVGLQYSGKKSDLPDKIGLDKLSGIFSFSFKRKDLLVPLVFSYSFGPEETYGNMSFGVVYGHSFISYGFAPSRLLVRYGGAEVARLPSFQEREHYSSFGAFVNAKLGYRYVYFLPSLSVYYQNYGSYEVFFGEKQRYKGLTIIPSVGIQLNFRQGKAR